MNLNVDSLLVRALALLALVIWAALLWVMWPFWVASMVIATMTFIYSLIRNTRSEGK